jgi:hypothetical protein
MTVERIRRHGTASAAILDNINSGATVLDAFTSFYTIGAGGVFTNAATGVGNTFKNAVDTNNGSVTIFDASGNNTFSAAPTAVVIGSSTSASSLAVNGSIANGGTGMKHARSSATMVSGGSRLEIMISWPGTAWATMGYTATCSVEQSTTVGTAQGLLGERIRTKNVTQIGYVVSNPTASSLTGTVNCIGMHD